MHVTQSKFSKAIQNHFKTGGGGGPRGRGPWTPFGLFLNFFRGGGGGGGARCAGPGSAFDYIVTFFKNVCGLDHLI